MSMLVLGRKVGEKIILQVCGKEIEVMVTKADRGFARLSFIADSDVKIYREELLTEGICSSGPGSVVPARTLHTEDSHEVRPQDSESQGRVQCLPEPEHDNQAALPADTAARGGVGG